MVCYMVPQTVPKTVHLLSTLPPLSCNEAKMRWSDGEEMVCYEVPQTVSPPSRLPSVWVAMPNRSSGCPDIQDVHKHKDDDGGEVVVAPGGQDVHVHRDEWCSVRRPP